MAAMVKENKKVLDNEQMDIRGLVMAGLQQVTEGKVKDFDAVCDRLEKKYLNGAVQN